MLALKLLVFVLAGAVMAWVSWRPLRAPGSHGFWRTFAWSCMLVLLYLNVDAWFEDPFSLRQLVSWLLLIASLFPLASGVHMLRTAGRPGPAPAGAATYAFENTTALVTTGIYRYIRHPLYASLLALNWGICLKEPGLVPVVLALAASVFLFLTARADEAEMLARFGPAYRAYMGATRRFVPFLF